MLVEADTGNYTLNLESNCRRLGLQTSSEFSSLAVVDGGRKRSSREMSWPGGVA